MDIPVNGSLRTPYSFFAGDYWINFLQKNEKGDYDTLYEELPSTKIDTSKNRIYFNRILTFEKYKSKDAYTVNAFYVGKKKSA